jgi:dTDP-4-dehydrorhamnose 3,5-epimerase
LKSLPTRIHGLVYLEPEVHSDDRGFFVETYERSRYRDFGIDVEFVQDNHSRSVLGTLRGLHYQRRPGQPKLVRAARGVIWDVVVDIRPDSNTFGEYEVFELEDSAHRQLFVPVGFAHGFCVLSDEVDVIYKVGTPYDPIEERGIAWDDPDLAIPWPIADPIVSVRDRENPRIAQIRATLGT